MDCTVRRPLFNATCVGYLIKAFADITEGLRCAEFGPRSFLFRFPLYSDAILQVQRAMDGSTAKCPEESDNLTSGTRDHYTCEGMAR